MVTLRQAIRSYMIHRSYAFLAGMNNVVYQWEKYRRKGLCDRVIDYIIYGYHQDRVVKKIGYFKYKEMTLTQAEKELRKSPSILHHYLDFEDIHKEFNMRLSKINGIGKLTIYDAALRFGFMQSPAVLPKKKVYVYAGAWKGLENLQRYSKRLGLSLFPVPIKKEGVYDISLFTTAFGKLPSMFIEDFLCVYEENLDKLDSINHEDLLKGMHFYGKYPAIKNCFTYNYDF